MTRPDLGRLLGSIPGLLTTSSLPDAAVGDAFGEAMAALARFDFVVVFAYRGEERPLDLHSTFGPDDYRVFVTLYQAGSYLLDPFFHAARAGRSGIFRMRELAPDRFFSSEYFRTYYSQTRLAEEIGFFVPTREGVTLVLSLMRKATTRAFSAREFDLLRQAEPFVAALVERFWQDLAARFDRAARRNRNPETAHSRANGVWGQLDLTAREAAIVDLVLQGHSSEAVGRRLAIATGTVKVHRRNVYRKLGISSQTQLLSLYLKNM
ncbi:helix-turn-helix transcriptional regulator [Mesorhizobium sp. LHD-90]|nr:helix-turn-helix transcriptional regulator [Mesorhizobium sp. LHD-90]MDQ6438290.1 helix-turn-helix transcriptional regulator [Mesorhizobium sp. LHD-90]